MTWEPPKSFKLLEVDPVTGSSYLPVYDEFVERVKKGEVEEYKEGVSVEAPIASAPSTQSSTSPGANVESEEKLDESTIEAIALRISLLEIVDKQKRARVLKSVVKAGVVIPENRKKAKQSEHWEKFLLAEEKELESFEELGVWELVPLPAGRKAIGTRWVYDVKVDVHGNITRHKARLVAQGFSPKQGTTKHSHLLCTLKQHAYSLH